MITHVPEDKGRCAALPPHEDGPSEAKETAGGCSDSPGVILGLTRLPDRALLTEDALARLLGVTNRTVRRMVARHELPPPVNFAGRSTWMAGRVMAHFEARAERAAKGAERAAARLRSVGGGV